jgi:polyprenyl P-hydroxybenzoate/phenylacrylic acid decarboxylase-like protein
MEALDSPPRRLIVGVTGATGVALAVRLLERLRDAGIERHLILSKWGARTLLHETSCTVEGARQLATRSYAATDQGAPVSSGSFLSAGMVIVPCSMKTLASIAHGHGDNLIHRTADVMLKERRKLVLVVREAPLNDIHLENMLKLSRMGVVIFPPVPAFYLRPQSVDELVDHTVVRVLDQFGMHVGGSPRWDGEMGVGARNEE